MEWLARDPLGALADFYVKANLGGDVPSDLPVSPVDLKWGIERLLENSRQASAMEGFEVHVGAGDALIDGGRLKELVPSVKLHDGIGHGLEGLLKSWKEDGQVG